MARPAGSVAQRAALLGTGGCCALEQGEGRVHPRPGPPRPLSLQPPVGHPPSVEPSGDILELGQVVMRAPQVDEVDGRASRYGVHLLVDRIQVGGGDLVGGQRSLALERLLEDP